MKKKFNVAKYNFTNKKIEYLFNDVKGYKNAYKLATYAMDKLKKFDELVILIPYVNIGIENFDENEIKDFVKKYSK